MSGTQIIIYVHICQFSHWQILFTKIMNAIKESGLYDQCKEIRLGVVNHIDKVVDEAILNDPKISCIIHGHCSLYERNTLLHIRKKSEEEYAQYLYVHTKGLKYLDGSREQFESDCVKDWVDLMIHWNIYNWRKNPKIWKYTNFTWKKNMTLDLEKFFLKRSIQNRKNLKMAIILINLYYHKL